MLTYGCLGKYVKKLVGRTDIEDVLGRLDRLMQDEVRMAAAQCLRAAHEVDDKVQAIEGTVHAVDDKVKSVEGKVQGVDDKVQGVDNKVQGVDDRVRDVDDKIDLIIDGVGTTLNSVQLGNEKIREEMKQVADDMGDQRRS